MYGLHLLTVKALNTLKKQLFIYDLCDLLA